MRKFIQFVSADPLASGNSFTRTSCIRYLSILLLHCPHTIYWFTYITHRCLYSKRSIGVPFINIHFFYFILWNMCVLQKPLFSLLCRGYVTLKSKLKAIFEVPAFRSNKLFSFNLLWIINKKALTRVVSTLLHCKRPHLTVIFLFVSVPASIIPITKITLSRIRANHYEVPKLQETVTPFNIETREKIMLEL